MSGPREDRWARTSTGAFEDVAREHYAMERARGLTMQKAGELAGVGVNTPTAWERDERMKQRIAELRKGASNYVTVTAEYVMDQLRGVAEDARRDGAYKASVEALKALYTIIKVDKDTARKAARKLGPTVTPKDVQNQLRASFQEDEQLPDEFFDTEGEEAKSVAE